jgi:hypothetical protein
VEVAIDLDRWEDTRDGSRCQDRAADRTLRQDRALARSQVGRGHVERNAGVAKVIAPEVLGHQVRDEAMIVQAEARVPQVPRDPPE